MNAEQIAHDVAARVREIVADAERRAEQIVRDAEAEAVRIRERAEAEGDERLEMVRRALSEIESRVARRAAAGDGDRGAPRDEVDPGPVTVPEPAPTPVPEPQPDPVPEPAPPPDEGTPPQATAGSAGAETGSGDAAAARLVAMNMALDGASRGEIEGHLAEKY